LVIDGTRVVVAARHIVHFTDPSDSTHPDSDFLITHVPSNDDESTMMTTSSSTLQGASSDQSDEIKMAKKKRKIQPSSEMSEQVKN